MEALMLQSVAKSFGGLSVLRDITFSVKQGERRAILGPNGAGKTTLFNMISGELTPTAGTIELFGANIEGLKPFDLPVRGLARTFQKNNLLLGLTVWENVRLAVQRRMGISWNLFRAVSGFQQLNEESEELLEQVGLTDRRGIPVKSLSYGEQRQVEVALALASRPKVLLLDEPTAGMSPAETHLTVERINMLPKDLTVLIIEHDMDVVTAVAETITVMHYGEVVADGLAEAVKRDPRVLEVYLGTGGDEVATHA
jgi:branched-chain amino acid transport system ATP-binding protein